MSSSDPDLSDHLIAHRGFPSRYPENTLIGLRAAVASGARFIEFDVQLSMDGIPVVIHDTDLQRTAGIQGNILSMDSDHISEIEVNETARFGDTFKGTNISTLNQISKYITSVSQLTAFVEIKRSSLRKFGHTVVVQPIMDALRPVIEQCIVISFDLEAVELARKLGADRIGWVIETWDQQTRSRAEQLVPDFLFCDHEILPAEENLWPGPWQWAIYETSDPEHALQLLNRGADLVETDAIGDMLTYFQNRQAGSQPGNQHGKPNHGL